MDNVKKSEKVVILGLGGAGGRIVQQLSRMPESSALELCVFDTDRRALDLLADLPENAKKLCGEQWLLGQGAGGDLVKGQRAFARENEKLQDLMLGVSLLVIVGGLGGGTATGGAGVICNRARSCGVTAVSLFELPFSFEGHGRCQTAENGLRDMLELSDTVLGIPNDLLFSVLPAETAFADAFRMADEELARTVLGVVDVLSKGNLLSADAGDLSTILKGRKSYAAVGVGMGNGADPTESCIQALANLMDSPFLGGSAKLKEADAVILNLTGGSTLSIANVQKTLESAGTLPGAHCRVLVGANVNENMANSVRLTAIAIKYDEREAAVRNTAEAKKNRRRTKTTVKEGSKPVQQTLPLTIASCGIFEGRTPTIIDGVNFDIPSFVRRQVVIDTGE